MALVLAGCAGSPSPVIPPAPLADFDTALDVKQAWAQRIGGGAAGHFLQLGPAYDGGMVFAASRRGVVSAHDTHTGKRLWHVDLAAPLSSGPGVGGDLLLMGGKAEIFALQRGNGEVRWHARVSSESLGSPVRAGDVVVARTVDGAVYGLAAADGRQLWRVQQTVPLLSLRGQATPLIAGEAVIVGFANGRVAAYALRDGSLLWETTVVVPRGRTELERLADIDGNLALGDGVLFVAGYQGRVGAIALANGRPLWSREISSYQGLAVAGREVFVSDDEGNVWALAQQNGGTLWRQDGLRGRQLSAPVVQGDAILVGDYDGYLHWIAREDGRFLARAQVRDPHELFPVPQAYDDPLRDIVEEQQVIAAPAVGDDQVFAYDKRGVLGAFRVSTP
jgi:outer membrane protein assembly factor BamB